MAFKDLSIRKKLAILLMGISSAAVLAACLAFYVLIVERYQQSYRDDLYSLADITASNCSASLAFGIPEDAQQLLASLNKKPSIVYAAIYDKDHKIFTTYKSKPETSVAVQRAKTGSKFFSGMTVSRTIELNDQKIGSITLYDDLSHIQSFKRLALFIAAVIIFVVLCFTALLAARLREIISRPISNLAEVAHAISSTQDYSLHAKKESSDEIGNLVDAFNDMLSQIAQRNEALQKSESRFRTFINQAVDAFFLHDLNGRLVDVNPRACESLGYTKQELLKMSMAEIFKVHDKEQHNAPYWASLPPDRPETLEGFQFCRDGSTFPVEVRVGFFELGDEKLVMVLARDISERLMAEKDRLALEAQLQHAQKMESIGTLAGGIAHDFNNILTPIFGYLDLALLKTPMNTELSSDLKQVRNAAQRAREMVQQILTFSRRDVGENIAPIQVHVIIKEALKLLRGSLPATIEIRQKIDSTCGNVLANPTQVHQVLMNLCTNAYHAMRQTGGVMTVSLLPLEISAADSIKNINLKPGSYVRLEVSDTGHGMDKKTIERIFEPYFTTKEQGEGTGMGLSVIHGIVKKIGGHITVYSEPGRGTTFHVYMPVHGRQEQQEILHEAPIPTGTERIMFVDDEKDIRHVGSNLLKSLGYSVQVFADPEEALEHFAAQPNSIDLLITDTTMPKMTGDKLATDCMAIRPDLPVIICTGFSDQMNEGVAQDLGIKAFISKPLIINSFGRTVRTVLNDALRSRE